MRIRFGMRNWLGFFEGYLPEELDKFLSELSTRPLVLFIFLYRRLFSSFSFISFFKH